MPMANLLDHALRRLNALPDQEARMELLSCCGSRRWAARVSSGRPYADNAALLTAADVAWNAATEADLREAFAAHPRIGEPERGGAQERGEQAASADADAATREALREGNLEYERRFGHLYLVFAERPQRPRAARRPAQASGQRPSDGARRRRRGAAPDHAGAAAEDAGAVTAITTHVLDTARGTPAAGVGVVLEAWENDGWRPLATAITGDDGRAPDLGLADAGAGTHRLVFATREYLGAGGLLPRGHRRDRGARRGAPARAAAARAVRLLDVPWQPMTSVLGTNQYGKAEVHMVTVSRDGALHTIRDLTVGITLSGDLADVHLTGDNAHVVPTDTQKNTVYAFAKMAPVGAIEDFGLRLGRHFVSSFAPISRARVHIVEAGWDRLGGHSFRQAGAESRVATVVCEAEENWVVSGLEGLVVLNSTDSEFAGFIEDRYTTLPETEDRVLATAVAAQWRHASSSSPDWDASFGAARGLLIDTFATTLQQVAAGHSVRDGRRDADGPARAGGGAHVVAQQAPLPRRPLPLRPRERQRGLPRRRPPLRAHRGGGARTGCAGRRPRLGPLPPGRMTFALHDAIAELATYNDDPAAGGITREVFTPTYERSVEFVSGLMRDAGLEVRRDAFGNLYGRLEGTDPSLPAVRTGSHVDTTLNAGRYDGVVGVLGAIEAVGCAARSGAAARGRGGRLRGRGAAVRQRLHRQPRGHGRAVARRPRPARRPRRRVARAGAGRRGFEPDAIETALWDPASVHAFVELHIEQGIVLESSGEQIGVVTAIAAPHDLRITLQGAADHAGATPMALRRDALVGAAEAMVELEKLAVGSPSGTTVGTVGVMRVRPGAINVVPGEVEFDVDVRDSDAEARQAVVDGFLAVVGVMATKRGLTAVVDEIVRDEPGTCAPFIVEAADAACASLGVRPRHMISGAYHDALILSRKIPVGMLFVPSAGGISHHPDEYTGREDIDRGAAVLGEVLATLAT